MICLSQRSSSENQVDCKDIDLFFILFVFAAKPMYKSAQTWFDKFEIGDKGYMSKQEWYELQPQYRIHEFWSRPSRVHFEAVLELASGCAAEDDGPHFKKHSAKA